MIYNYSQDWSAKLHESPSARTYILHKDALIFSKYIYEIKIEKWRISLTRFRTNNHKLAIETGRWNKSPINERKFLFRAQRWISFFIGMQIVHNFKETHFTKVLLEQFKYDKIF